MQCACYSALTKKQYTTYSCHRLTQQIEYIAPPILPPSPPTLLHSISEFGEENQSQVPSQSPQWPWREKEFPPFSIKGVLFQTTDVDVECCVSNSIFSLYFPYIFIISTDYSASHISCLT